MPCQVAAQGIVGGAVSSAGPRVGLLAGSPLACQGRFAGSAPYRLSRFCGTNRLAGIMRGWSIPSAVSSLCEVRTASMFGIRLAVHKLAPEAQSGIGAERHAQFRFFPGGSNLSGRGSTAQFSGRSSNRRASNTRSGAKPLLFSIAYKERVI